MFTSQIHYRLEDFFALVELNFFSFRVVIQQNILRQLLACAALAFNLLQHETIPDTKSNTTICFYRTLLLLRSSFSSQLHWCLSLSRLHHNVASWSFNTESSSHYVLHSLLFAVAQKTSLSNSKSIINSWNKMIHFCHKRSFWWFSIHCRNQHTHFALSTKKFVDLLL